MKKLFKFRNIISFDKSAKNFILKSLGIISKDGYLFYDTGKKVLDKNNEHVLLDNFKGITKDKKGNNIIITR